VRTLLSGAVVATCDAQHTVHAPGDVVIEDDRVAYVGAAYDGPSDVRRDLSGFLLMPGLINAHTHSPMTLFRSLADDVDLQVFLHERVWPREIVLTSDDVYAGSLLANIEMLKAGVTTSVDMYFWEEDSAQAALDSGIRTVITPGILQAPAWEPILGTWEKRTQDVLEFCRRWDGREGRISAGFGPHAPYTLPLEALGEISAVARDAGFPVHIHLVETAVERDSFNAQGRGSTAHVLGELGFFDAQVLAAHSIWLDPGDLEIFATKRVAVAHCPQSNAKLGAGIAQVTDMLRHGILVGLGTDGAATNNNLDLWEEMRLAPLLAKVTELDPKPVPATAALWMATRLGAEAIRRPEIGSLEPGRQADVVSITLQDTTAVPVFGTRTYVDHLVYSMGRHSVRSVWVRGREVVQDGQVTTVDEGQAREAAQRSARAVSERIGR
jgi:5-methylthioadenosine/S-adenosylhomocysteine deaminase